MCSALESECVWMSSSDEQRDTLQLQRQIRVESFRVRKKRRNNTIDDPSETERWGIWREEFEPEEVEPSVIERCVDERRRFEEDCVDQFAEAVRGAEVSVVCVP